MKKDELLKMYSAIKDNSELFVLEAGRKRLINFARYIQPDLVLEPFHVVYYTLLDMFAHGLIRKMIVQMPLSMASFCLIMRKFLPLMGLLSMGI